MIGDYEAPTKDDPLGCHIVHWCFAVPQIICIVGMALVIYAPIMAVCMLLQAAQWKK